jgi:hypothetical protein
MGTALTTTLKLNRLLLDDNRGIVRTSSVAHGAAGVIRPGVDGAGAVGLLFVSRRSHGLSVLQLTQTQ